jgi:hypothetical protein
MIVPSVVSPGEPALPAAPSCVVLAECPQGARFLRSPSQYALQDGGTNAASPRRIAQHYVEAGGLFGQSIIRSPEGTV